MRDYSDTPNLRNHFYGNDEKRKKDRILELSAVSRFQIGTPILLCKNDINGKQGEIGKIIEIIDFDRLLVDFTQPFVFKNKKNNKLKNSKALASRLPCEAIVLMDLPENL